MHEILSNYKIVRKLGDQARRKFGEVFLLEAPDGRKAVLKLVRKNSANEKLAERLRQEAKFSFQNPQLPAVLSFTETSSEIALMLEYREGVPLTEWAGKMSYRERKKRLPDVLEALFASLAFIHQNQIVHLDLKPDNLLVAETGSALKISIIDFGLAMHLSSPEQRGTLFSLPYSAPELILNKSTILDRSSDFFSVGMVIYHFLERRLPFQSSNPSVYTNLQLAHPIPAVNGISKAQNILLQELTAKPRFRNAPNLMRDEDVISALQAAMQRRISVVDRFVQQWKEAESKPLLRRIFG